VVDKVAEGLKNATMGIASDGKGGNTACLLIGTTDLAMR
jgi:hypothetical protein